MKKTRLILLGASVIALAALCLPWKGARHKLSSHAFVEAMLPAVARPVTQTPTSAPEISEREAEPAFAAFKDWVDRFVAAKSEQEKQELMDEGEKVATWRRSVLEELIPRNPAKALSAMVPDGIRKQLPASVQDLLEQPVSGHGDLEVWVAHSSKPEQENSVLRQIEVDGRKFDAFVYGWRANQRAAHDMPFHGMAIGSKLAVDDKIVRILSQDEASEPAGSAKEEIPWAGLRPRQPGTRAVRVKVGRRVAEVASEAEASALNERLTSMESAESGLGSSSDSNLAFFFGPPSQGRRKLLYIRVNFPDDPREPISESRAQAIMTEVNQFYSDWSYNTLNISTVVTPVLTLPQPKEFYHVTNRVPTFFGRFGNVISDARIAARAAGFIPDEYDLEVVHAVPVPGFGQSLSSVNGRDNLLLDAGPGGLGRAFGFNFGLNYANSWNTRDEPRTLDGDPYPPNPRAPNANYPIDVDSRIGLDGINTPGRSHEARDPFDCMGGGGAPRGQYNIISKGALGWLPGQALRGITRSETNRIYAFDSPERVEGRLYGLVIRKNPYRNYWAQFRHLWTNNVWLSNGLELHWPSSGPFDPDDSGSTDLIDTTPGSPDGVNDAAIVLGRTFTDPEARLHITPFAKGGVGSEQWLDVAVNIGLFPGNEAPVVNLTASALNVQPGTAVTFTAAATDANQDSLAYHWEENSLPLVTNSPVVTRTFSNPGHYVLRCEVSDMRGGKTIKHLLVTVGTPATFYMSGRVLDPENMPIAGARVHNGRQGSEYRVAFTDSDGAYTIPDIANGNYDNRAFLYGYKTDPLTFFNPVTISGANAANLNHIAFPVTKVSVTAGGDVDEDSDDGGAGYFVVSRTGDTSADLIVPFTLSGRASLGGDFTVPPSNSVVIPAGQSSVPLNIQPIPDDIGEGPESVIMTLDLQTRGEKVGTILTNVGGSNIVITVTNQIRFRGYELLIENGDPVWHQTYPFYVLGDREATLNIVDRDSPSIPNVSFVYSLFVGNTTAFESGNGSAFVYIGRSGSLVEPLTVHYRVGGTATNGADYVRLPGRITIPAGQEFVVLPIVPLDDSLVEANESVTIDLLPDPAYTGSGSGSISMTIVDDDLSLVTLMSPDNIGSEVSADPAVFRVARAGDLSRELEVYYQIIGGTATEGSDFVALSRSVIIPAGQLAMDFSVTPIPDATPEGNESLTLLLVDASTYNIGRPNSATVTIRDQPLPVVTLEVTDASAGEPSDSAVYTLTRSGLTTDSLTVNFTVGGTATPADYAAIGTNVVFAPGDSTATITITPVEDNFHETNETVIIRLLPAPGYNLGQIYQGSSTISWNDGSNLPEVSFVAQQAAVPEAGGNAARVMVQLSAAITGSNRAPVTVAWRVVGGSATQNSDYYGQNSGYLTFDFRQTTVQVINIDPLNDSLQEPNETVVLGLFDPDLFITNNVVVSNATGVVTNEVVTRAQTNAFLGAFRTHTLTILDDDLSVISLSVPDPIAAESGQDPGTFIVSRSGSTNAAQTVFFAIGGNAAHGSDYAAIGDSVTIPAGATSVAVNVLPSDDPEEESDEVVRIELVRAPGAQISSTSGQISILDNDGTLQFLTSVYQVAENAGEAQVAVVRSRDTNRVGRVEYFIGDGTATRPQDYNASSGVLDFAPGEWLKTIRIPIVDDSIVEPDETVILVLTNATGGVPIGGQSTAILYINNDDTTYELAANPFTANENAGSAGITIYRLGLVDAPSSVEFSARTNSAVSPGDFTAISNQVVSFGVGETSRTVSVTIQNDTLFEGNETVSLLLTNPSPGTLLGPINTSSLIIADDECSLAFSSATFSTNEFAPYAAVVVTRSGGTANPVFVDFATVDGTATNQSDYIAQQGRLQFAGEGFVLRPDGSGQFEFRAGETSKNILIPLIDDVVGDGQKTFSVVLSNPGSTATNTPPGSTVLGHSATPTNAVVTIIDNESPGGIDYEYNPGTGADGPVHAVTLQIDKAVFGGAFTNVDGINLPRIARLHAGGTLDLTFVAGTGADNTVLALAAQPDGKIIVGGSFGMLSGVTRTRLARLNANGTLDTGFVPPGGANATVRAVAVQQNGKILVAGEFTQLNSVPRSRLARVNADGSLDTAFAPGINGTVNAVAIQSDNKIVIAGLFSNVSGTPRNGIARLNADGSLDDTFNPDGGANGSINTLAVAANGRIVVGGAFTSFDGVARNRIAGLNQDGSVHLAFNVGTGANGNVNSIVINATGRIVLGGEFTSINGVPRGRIARLRADGSLDNSFDPGTGANAAVRSLAIQPDTAVIVGGDFTSINGVPRNRIARIHGDERSNLVAVELANSSLSIPENAGTATVSILRIGNTNLSFSVNLIATNTAGPNSATAGQDFVATNITVTFNPGDVARVAEVRILNDTQVEVDEFISLSFAGGTGNVDVSASAGGLIRIIDDEQSLRFSTNSFMVSEGEGAANVTIVREGLPAGTVTVEFSALEDSAVSPDDFTATNFVVSFADGEISKTVPVHIAADLFEEPLETVDLVLSNPQGAFIGSPGIATLVINDDFAPGSVDLAFNPGLGANNYVRAVAVQRDGKLVVAGAFTSFASSNRNYFTRLNADGSLDGTFRSTNGANALVSAIAIAPNDRILLGGQFSSVDTVPFSRVARLLTNGVPDINFNQVPGINGTVNSLAAHANGRVAVGGGFNLPAQGLTQLRGNGSVDTAFNPGAGANGVVHAVATAADGSVFIAGAFSVVNSVTRSRVAWLNPDGTVNLAFVPQQITTGIVYAVARQTNGQMLIAGEFYTTLSTNRYSIARLNADGSLDSTFNSTLNVNGTVFAMALQPSGRIIIGGNFTSINGATRNRFARLNPDGTLDGSFGLGAGANNTVLAVAVLPDNNIVLGGDFTSVDGVARRGIAKLFGNEVETRFVSISVPSNGQAYLGLSVTPGLTYVIEGSTNLLNWAALSTNAASGATLNVVDPDAGNYKNRFYRARQAGQ